MGAPPVTMTSTTPEPAFIDDRSHLPMKDIGVPFVVVVLVLLSLCVVIAYAKRRKRRLKANEAKRLRQMKTMSGMKTIGGGVPMSMYSMYC